MRKRKVVICLIALIMTMLLAFTGCSKGDEKINEPDENFNELGYPIVNEPIILKLLGERQINQGPWEEMEFFKQMEIKTNIKFDIEAIPQEIYMEKRGLIFASDDLPDVLYRARLSIIDEYSLSKRKVLIPLNDLISKYAPNISGLFEKFGAELTGQISMIDGYIYTLPQITEHNDRVRLSKWINTKWLEKVNMEMPTTTKEFYDVLVAFKNAGDLNGNGKDDEIPYSFDSNWGIKQNSIYGAWGLVDTLTVSDPSHHMDIIDGKIRFVPTDPKYKEVLAFINKLYEEGLLDPECITQPYTKVIAKGGQGRVGIMDAGSPSWMGKYGEDYTQVPTLKGPYGDKIWTNYLSMVSITGTFAITKANKYPEATIRWVDYFYSEEGALFANRGIEGIGFEYNEDGNTVYTEYITNNPDGLTAGQALGKITPAINGVPYIYSQAASDLWIRNPHNMIRMIESTKNHLPDLPKEFLYPSKIKFTEEELDIIIPIQKDINEYVNEMQIKFIVGTEPLSNWDEYIKVLEKLQVEKLIKYYQEGYDRAK